MAFPACALTAALMAHDALQQRAAPR
jgi:hypothetical protein